MSENKAEDVPEKPYEYDTEITHVTGEEINISDAEVEAETEHDEKEKEKIQQTFPDDVGDLLGRFEKIMSDAGYSVFTEDSVGIDCDERSEEKIDEYDFRTMVPEEWVAGLIPDIQSVYRREGELPLSEEEFSGVDKTLLDEAVTQAKEEMVLDEDNPMIKKFQEVLKAHLLRQIEKIRKNILEIEGDYKKQEAIFKEDADNIYKAELIVKKQRENLNSYKDKIEQVSNLRQRIDDDMKSQDDGFNALKKTFEDKKVELEECQCESDMLADLIRKMSEYDKEQEREIGISKKKQDINLKDRERLAKEKQALDMLLWRLQKQILAKKRETESRLNKCKIKSQECQVISNKLLQATVERAGLLMENQTISKELEKSFMRIKQIDTVLQKTKDELEEAKTNWGKLKMSLRWYKKHSKMLMEQNSHLLEDRRRAKDDLDFYSDKLENLKEKRYTAMEELNAYDELMKITEKDLNDVLQRQQSLKADEETILLKISKASLEKSVLEKKYLEKLSSLEITDKMVKNTNDMIAKMVEEHQKQELKMYKVENNVSKLMVELEKTKGALRDVEYEMDSINRQIREAEEALKGPEERLKYMRSKEMKCKNAIVEKKKELEKLEAAWKHKTYLDTPLFIKKRDIEYNIKQLKKSIEEKEILWMQMQEGCLRATKKRNDQLEKINCLKKQTGIMDTSIERTVQKIKKEQVELREIISELKAVTHRMEQLQETEIKQGQAKIKAEEVNKDREDEFINILKDLEKTVMTIQQEIWDLEEVNQEQIETVETLQKELLEWNKKYNMAIQMKKEMDAEKSKGGEVMAMKQEIHRMEVRYTNLRKVEEKMISDLEFCLSRRDSLVDSAEAREKRAKACGISTRVFAWRKLEETRAKLRSMIRAARELKQEKEACLAQRKVLSEELTFWRNNVDSLSQSLQKLEQQIQEGQIHRHRALEMTVMRQRKSKLLEELRMGRYRIAVTEDNLMVQEENVFAIRNAILHILDELKNDFPNLNLQLLQIENTISYSIDPENK